MNVEFRPQTSVGQIETTRPAVMLVFDGYYSNRENIVASYVNNAIEQLPHCKDFSVFTKGNYRGSKLDSKKVRVKHFSSFERAEAERKLGRRLKHMLVSAVVSQPSTNYWYSSVSAYEETIVQELFRADEFQAVAVFSQSPEFILRVARYVHLFAGSRTPHIIGITPMDRADAETVRDLQWLGVTTLVDGEIMPGADEQIKSANSVVSGTVSFSKGWQRITNYLSDFGRSSEPDTIEEKKPEPKSVRKGLGKIKKVETRAPVAKMEPLSTGPRQSFFDDVTFPYRVNISNNRVDWNVLAGAGRHLPRRVRDIVLFVRPDWASCGSGTYFESLARHFRETDTLMLDIALYPFKVPFEPEHRVTKFAEEQRFIRAAATFSVRQSDGWLYNLKSFSKYFAYRPKSSINHIMLSYSYCARPKLMEEVIRHASITKIYVNHYFNYLFAKPYMNGRKFLLDTHDLQSINAVHHMYRNNASGRLDKFSTLMEEEINVLRRADKLSFVSLSEIEIAKKYIDGDRIINFIAVPKVDPLPQKKLSKSIKVLLVASRNPANEHNIDWFLANVWPVVLKKRAAAGLRSIELNVCGSINSYVAGKTFPGVKFHGIVDNLRLHYEEANLVVLPVVSGGGAAMKAIEALLYERPVVGTKHAYRGLPETISNATGYHNDPVDLAQAVIAAVRSPAAYRLVSQRTREAAQLLRRQDYFSRLDTALEEIRTEQ